MKVYKIFDLGWLGDDPVPRTLFHGLPFQAFEASRCTRSGRTRTLPIDEWLHAEIKPVVDGSRRTPYNSGFHCYTNLDAVKQWFKRARRSNRVVVMVEINDDARVKPGAVRHTLLAHRMKIHAADWANRIPAAEFDKRSHELQTT